MFGLTAFAIYLIVTFAAFDESFLIFAIVYTILAYLAAVLSDYIRRLIDNNQNGCNCNNTNSCNRNDAVSDNCNGINSCNYNINSSDNYNCIDSDNNNRVSSCNSNRNEYNNDDSVSYLRYRNRRYKMQ